MAVRRLMVAVLLSIVVAACAHVTEERGGDGPRIRAMTYNIRLDLASDGANAWPKRAALVAALVQHEAPDVLGMQEVLKHQKAFLETALPAYGFVGVARDDGLEQGEYSPLAWRKNRFELLDSGTFWLSPTPSTPSKGWDAAYPRIATWATLRDRRSGKRFVALNTHFDHMGEIARVQSATVIADWAKRRREAGKGVIILGDFNATPASAAMTLLLNTAQTGFRDTRTATSDEPYGPAGTFNGFRIDCDAAAPIDHILVSSDFRVLSYQVVTQHWGGRLPSDHYPVIADLEPR